MMPPVPPNLKTDQRTSADGIVVADDLVIPNREVRFTFTRSGGPGGQNVNKVNTRVTLLFEPENSSVLTPGQVGLIRERLSSRIGSDGVLRVVSQQSRSQSANREAAQERLARILADALYERPERRDTSPPRSVARRRLEDKRLRGRLKQSRRRDWPDE
jgi:ribosome-associated protein